ncbi:MAG: hypothetical protein ACTSVU_06700 [Promethearchaeota archaeon]
MYIIAFTPKVRVLDTFGIIALIYLKMVMIMSPNYRTSNKIIQTILEGILRADQNHLLIKEGIVKSHLIKYCGLKPAIAEKYLTKMENADYIKSRNATWGARNITIYDITALGRERYEWFLKINAELGN